MMTPPHRPSKPRHLTYRVGVWCCHCGKARDFIYNKPHWVCTECQFVETTAEGELAEKPWGNEEVGC